ncbi:hypothetical protein PV327_005293 [Microctonus hyperodae]|uniref:Uncharacterized protein n=1 Tax=Microctonus hyperodae TaxID=165561 RepID=A0AA39G1U0_MICHY|nr:hypothetical protein PV327_005293 [Microctonus hyperodae]
MAENSQVEDTVIDVIDDMDEQEIKESVEPIPKKKSMFKSPKKNTNTVVRRGYRNATTSKAEEAYGILQDTIAKRNMRDESTIYGEHIASKHRKYSAQTKSVIEHHIGELLFYTDMGRYEGNVFSSGVDLHNCYSEQQPISNSLQMHNNALSTIPIPTPSPADSYISTTSSSGLSDNLFFREDNSQTSLKNYVTTFSPSF